jgi:HEAT repeat protein
LSTAFIPVMQQQITVLRVFIASPSDLSPEREALREVVNELNAVFAKETDLRIELLGWEDTLPGGGRPQDLINRDVDQANLFVGCLWRRWGTVAGTDGKTGFEEEFERAVERRQGGGDPEIWLFFKDIADEERQDPGEHLKKVLAFRDAEEKGKRLLFQRFSDTADWRRRIHPLLNRLLLRILRHNLAEQQVQAPQSQQVPSSAVSGNAAQSLPTSSPATASIVTLLRDASTELSAMSLTDFMNSDAFTNARSVRLLVFSSSLYSEKVQSTEFGAHEANSAYWHRQSLKITGQERLFLIKTALRDLSLTKPGWYWASRWTVSMSLWLPWFVTKDGDEGTRIQAIEFATEIGFPLHGTTAFKSIYSALEDSSVGVQRAALKFLNKHGPASAVAAIRQMSVRSDERVRAYAEATIVSIKIRFNPDQQLKRILKSRDPVNPGIIEALRARVGDLSVASLERCLDHVDSGLRALAASELQKRECLSIPFALQLVSDDSASVREPAFRALIDHQAAPSPSEIRTQLMSRRPPLYISSFTGEPNADSVIAYYFGKASQDKLWYHIDLFDENSYLALRALCERFFFENRGAIRADLAEDFKKRAEAAKMRRDQDTLMRSVVSLFGGDPIETERKRLRAAALNGLANHPAEEDVDVFLRFLSSELSAVDQVVACLRGLAAIGQESCLPAIKPLLESSAPSVKAAAARTHLLLSSDRNVAAADLLTRASEPILWIVVASAVQEKDCNLWRVLRPFLNDGDPDIRRLVSYYATSLFGRTALLKELNVYLKATPYYYNVVTLFDRALYAPRKAQSVFKAQEKSYFSKLSEEATRGWPGLTL